MGTAEWLMLVVLSVLWGGTFFFAEVALEEVQALTLVFARVGLAAVALVLAVYATGQRMPGGIALWAAFFAMGALNNLIPFSLIFWGQTRITGGLAAILNASTPLFAVVLAHFLVHGERMTAPRIGGFALGFLGIVLLMEPAAVAGIGGAALQVISQLSVLCGALCYAAISVMARLLVRSDFLVASTGTLLVSSVIVIPLTLALDTPWTLRPGASSVAAIVWLGVGPTAIATILYFRLISSAGPTFMSLVNYLSPAVAVFLGVTLLGEQPGANAYAGLVLILGGIGLTQWRGRRT